jgi:hypothetical protein
MSGGRWRVHPRSPDTQGLVPRPALMTPSARRWWIGTAVFVLVSYAWNVITQPQYGLSSLPFVGFLALGALWMTWGSSWLDTANGTLVTVHGRWLTERTQLADGTTVTLVPDQIGRVLLAMRSPGSRRRRFIVLLAMTLYVENSTSPAVLRTLAGTLERHGAVGAADVVPVLLAQAAHLDAGGGPGTSPPAALLGDEDVRDTPPAQVAR